MTGFALISQPWIPVTCVAYADRFGIFCMTPSSEAFGQQFLGVKPRFGGDDVGSTGARGQSQRGWA
jgi:hypothetical protein